jgi:hypothetical protein
LFFAPPLPDRLGLVWPQATCIAVALRWGCSLAFHAEIQSKEISTMTQNNNQSLADGKTCAQKQESNCTLTDQQLAFAELLGRLLAERWLTERGGNEPATRAQRRKRK